MKNETLPDDASPAPEKPKPITPEQAFAEFRSEGFLGKLSVARSRRPRAVARHKGETFAMMAKRLGR